jgi:hypothetical protein
MIADSGFDPGFADPRFADPGFADSGFADPGFADSGFADERFGIRDWGSVLSKLVVRVIEHDTIC